MPLANFISPLILLFLVFCYCLWQYGNLNKAYSDLRKRPKKIAIETKWFAWRLLLIATILLVFTFWIYPERLFSFVLNKPYVFLMVAVFYPVASVIPQEFIYRAFFFKRYRDLFQSETTFIFLNGLAFALLHVIYLNPVAIVLSFFGGLVFAHSYSQTRSFFLVCVEHYLYGMLIFTIGLGKFFYIGLF